jgi:hypothetical protein
MVIKLFKNFITEKVFSNSQTQVESSDQNQTNDLISATSASAQTKPDLSNLSATASDVVAAYKIFLKRLPESMDVTNSRVGMDTDKLLLAFFCSDEFLFYEDNRELILELSKRVKENNLNALKSE